LPSLKFETFLVKVEKEILKELKRSLINGKFREIFRMDSREKYELKNPNMMIVSEIKVVRMRIEQKESHEKQ